MSVLCLRSCAANSGLFIEALEGNIAHPWTRCTLGLSGTDFDILVRPDCSPSRRLRMTDLVAQTALCTSGITRVVDRLSD